MNEKGKPFYLTPLPHGGYFMFTIVGLNALLSLFCFLYLIITYSISAPNSIVLFFAVFSAYFFSDFVSGMVHWATDTWFTEKSPGLSRVIAIAREHHTHPHHILRYRFVEHATLGSIPSAIVIGPSAIIVASLDYSASTYVLMLFFFAISFTLLFGTSFHNFGHRKAKSPLVKLAQRLHLIITPKHHIQHHRGDHTTHYCTVNGWANYPCDYFRVWRRLEALVARLGGGRPRENDEYWKSYLNRHGTLPKLGDR